MSSIGPSQAASSPFDSSLSFSAIINSPSSSRSAITSSPTQLTPSTSLSRLANHSSSSPPSIRIPHPSSPIPEWTYPPSGSYSIAFVVNGDLEYSDSSITSDSLRSDFEKPELSIKTLTESDQKLAQLINSFVERVLVDGGAHHARRLAISPTFAVGDFDSMLPSTGDHFGELHKRAVILIHDKDQTDLEAGINLTIDEAPFTNISDSNRTKLRLIADKVYQMVVFGGLGGRIDHAMGNVILLLRFPGRLFLYTENQWIFALDKRDEEYDPLTISTEGFHSLSVLPLYGSGSVTFYNEEGPQDIQRVTQDPYIKQLNGNKNLRLRVSEGILIFCLDKTPPPPPLNLEQSLVSIPLVYSPNFSARRPFVEIYRELQGLSSASAPLQERDAQGDVLRIIQLITPEHPLAQSVANRNIVSLIPFKGPVEGVVTEGLFWYLPLGHFTGFTKDFIGISNYATGTSIKVSVTAGSLLCVINVKEFEPLPKVDIDDEKKNQNYDTTSEKVISPHEFKDKENSENLEPTSLASFRKNLMDMFNQKPPLGIQSPKKIKMVSPPNREKEDK